MSFTRTLPAFRQATRSLLSQSLPHSVVPSSSSSLFRLAPSAVRPFSASVQQWRYSPVADDPKWKNNQKVTYEELKPITQSPDNVSRLLFTTSRSSS